MNTERLMQIIQAPLITEKSTMVGETAGQIALKVAPDATKPEIKAAFELLFKLEVQSVTVLNRKGKRKTFRTRTRETLGRRKLQRIAYVSLKPGQEVDVEEVK